jgi:hypothetical protein
MTKLITATISSSEIYKWVRMDAAFHLAVKSVNHDKTEDLDFNHCSPYRKASAYLFPETDEAMIARIVKRDAKAREKWEAKAKDQTDVQ